MRMTIAVDEFGRLVCSLADGASQAVVTASDFGGACDGLSRAVEALERNGIGECYWAEGGGEYRWVFRRDADRARVAVLWSAGVMTGWEHVFWTESAFGECVACVKAELARAALTA